MPTTIDGHEIDVDDEGFRMSADMQHLEEEDLDEEVEAIISASDFIEKTAGARMLFIWDLSP